jgi:hypothetical protein
MRGADTIFQLRCRGAQGQAHGNIKGGGHFVQDGGGLQLAEVQQIY